ncbi:hypothetical protein [Paenibacillus sp. XY044]|uniref:hypothetical protein n=1 Tax=Paenibacillus sp. XY044 TaxID=2026089 RepID=UPI000B99842C|nr:hypothetical protein [Paenibacillus sp. XY044]OZB97827.1 hypothetical protein CJP46_01220 [Paenibacillus sp. XY044]
MSMKAVEMQIAIPRTSEVGKVQNELHHRPAQDQQFLAEQGIKETAEMSKRSESVDETADAAIRDEGGRNKQRRNQTASTSAEESADLQDAQHPFKGHHLDVSL